MNDVSLNVASESPDVIANRLINKAEYRDGLQEIAVGLLILTLVPLARVIHKDSFGSIELVVFMILPTVMVVVSQWAIKEVRMRFLIGKEGFVQLKPISRKRLAITFGRGLGRAFVIGAVGMVGGILVTVAIHKGWGAALWGLLPRDSWELVETGILGGAVMIFYSRLPRYLIGGVTMAGMGILLTFSRVSFDVGVVVLGGIAVLLPVISGTMALFLFLRQSDAVAR